MADRSRRVSFRIVLSLKLSGNAFPFQEGAGVKPSFCPHSRQVGRLRKIACWRKGRIDGESPQLCSIPLVHSAESPKFALHSVVEAVVIRIASCEAISAYVIVRVNMVNDMDREG